MSARAKPSPKTVRRNVPLPARLQRAAHALAALLIGKSGLRPGAPIAEVASALGFDLFVDHDGRDGMSGFCIALVGSPDLIASRSAVPLNIAVALMQECVDGRRWPVPPATARAFLLAAAEALLSPDLGERPDLSSLAGIPIRLPPFSRAAWEWEFERPWWRYFGAKGVPEPTWRRAINTPFCEHTPAQRRLMAGLERWSRKQLVTP